MGVAAPAWLDLGFLPETNTRYSCWTWIQERSPKLLQARMVPRLAVPGSSYIAFVSARFPIIGFWWEYGWCLQEAEDKPTYIRDGAAPLRRLTAAGLLLRA